MSRCRRITLALVFLSDVARSGVAQSLRIYHIDVDQASATLFVSPAGRTLLVDSGKNGQGERIRSALQSAGVDRIDFFVDTHYHEDHYGGIDEVVDAGVPVGTAYDRGDKGFLPASKLGDATYKDYDRTVGHNAEQLIRGKTIPLDPLMTVTCTNAGGVVLGESDPPQQAGEENDMSIGLLIIFGGFRYWIGGDTEKPTEDKIAAEDLVQDVDVYVADHHGADNGSSAAFLADLRPTVVIISNGSNRTFRHPRASTLARMRSLTPQPTIFQLNKYLGTGDDGGNVAAAFIADPETVDDDGTILVTVDQNAGSFTVSYGTTTQSFNVKAPAAPAPGLVAAGGGQVVITRLLPDPTAEPDRIAERVTLRNAGTTGVDLNDWFLRGSNGRVWSLSSLATVGGGKSASIRRNAMAMSLDNDGGTVALVDAAGQVVDSVSYPSSQPGVEIVTGH
ncbi:MAG: lamin tail domain-containing protein [Gemmatimonadales bacterium]